MKLHMESTIFGQLMRSVTCNKAFQYPDERNPSLWRKSIKQDGLQEPQQPQSTSQDLDGASNVSYDEAQKNTASEKQTENDRGDSDALVVGWYGPDDMEVGFPVAHGLQCCN